MNSDDLTVFSHVALVGSISRAAIEMGTDQSTVSRRIALLEAELGVRLFHRSGRGVEPTERGRELLEHAAAVSRALDEARRSMQEGAGRGPARLCIAAQPTIARIAFGALGHAFRERYPLTQVRFVEGLASQLIGMVGDGAVDIAMLYVPERPGALAFDPLLSEGMQLITPPDHSLEGEDFDTRHLGDVPLILPSTHHGIRVMVETLAARHGFPLNVTLECDGSISITKRLVMQGCGCTVLPLAAVVDDVSAGRLKSYRLVNPEVRRTVALTFGRNTMAPTVLWEAVRVIKERVGELVRSGQWPDAALGGSARRAAA